jgi:hypothetical protein
MARGPLAGPAGPGKFSTRTDGLSFQSPEYGAGVEQAAIKAGAPLASTPNVRPTSRSEMGMAPSQTPVTSLYAPSERPNEPITSGIPMGEGPGPEALGFSNARQADADIIAKYMPALDAMASAPDSPQSFRIFVRNLQGNL